MRGWKSVPVLRVEEHPNQFQVETGYGGITVPKTSLPEGYQLKVGEVLEVLVDDLDARLWPGDKLHGVRLAQ